MMLVKTTDPKSIALASEAVRKGDLIVYPTDTIYGIGADARSETAVRKVDTLKNREGKPISIVVTDMAMAEQYCVVSPLAAKYAKQLLPGPYTFVLDRKGEKIARSAAGDTIGIRIPKNDFTLTLVHQLGFPIISTSANISGKPPACDMEELDGSIRDGVAVVVDGGPCALRESSTVVDMRGNTPVVLRRGAGYARLLELQKSLL
ncbi:Threonylcarbamoyl-AMP synthase [Candidatus Burarchaeum australiense]|nr:Threonylcarbamoyl-AMP synthase [Candidatus Burarchaeum australiense]